MTNSLLNRKTNKPAEDGELVELPAEVRPPETSIGDGRGLEAKLEELRAQAREHHVSLCRLLGYVKDRIPEITPWDLFASAVMIAEGRNQNPIADATAVERAARVADDLVRERQRRFEKGDEK